MLGIVLLLYIITQSLAVAAIGLVDGDAFLTTFSLLCMTPFLAIFIYSRRPKLTHVIVATPDQNGNLQHNLPNFRVLNTPSPTRFTHHLVRDSPPLEMPKTSTLWIVFSLTIVFAALGLLPVMVSDNPAWLLLALFIGVPAWLLGFSLPVHAWWAFSTTDNFKDCIVKAVNRGHDADTTGAVAGMIAGRYYGLSKIPKEFTENLIMFKELYNTAFKLSHIESI